MKSYEVLVPEAEYTIEIGVEILKERLIQFISTSVSTDLIVVVTNETIHKLYPFEIRNVLSSLEIPVETCILPDGEQYKTLETLNQIYDFLLDKNANRKTLLIAFGGGVIGDMTGFAAATFMRGISFIQVPTTLLAQVDSSVGGKTAVNHALGKNTIGAFKQPVYVCMELNFLKTLPERELKAGYLELVKHGIIHNASLFNFLKQFQLLPLDFTFLEEAIHLSCEVKANVVALDEKEKGLRATLNFGHTLGHLIETHTNYSEYLHGEAVGVGMVFATFLSKQLGYLNDNIYVEIIQLLQEIISSITLPYLSKENFTSLILHDKKSVKHAINFILIEDIGKSFIENEMSPDVLWKHFLLFLEMFPWACKMRQS